MITQELRNSVLNTLKIGFNRLNPLERRAILKMVGETKTDIKALSDDALTSRFLLLYSQHIDRTTKDVDIKDAQPEPVYKKAAQFISGELKKELETITKNY